MRIYLRTWRDEKGVLRRARTYSLLYYIGGARHHLSLRTRDKRAAELIAGDIVRRAELRRAGILDPFGESKEKGLEEHLADFETTMRARGVVEKYVRDRLGCLGAFAEHAGAKRIADLDLPGASGWLTSLRERGLSARSVNVRYQALKQLGIWLVRTRRAQFDPFDGLRPLNEQEDRRHVRRALTPDEAARLLEATRARAVARAGRPHPRAKPERRARAERTLAKMTALGEARRVVYLLAMGTGLRRGELRRLRWADVDLERGRVTVTAASAKSRRVQHVDLHGRLVEELAALRPADAAPTSPVVPPRAFPNIVTFDADLRAAGIAKTDSEGRVVDFHALRTTFISWLGASGAHPRVAQALARHASVETTMERYTDLRLFDLKGDGRAASAPGQGRQDRRDRLTAHVPTCGTPLRVGRLPLLAALVWVAVVAITTVTSLQTWRRQLQGAWRPWVLATLIFFIPWATVLLFVAAFGVGNSHPLVQFNDPSTLGLWKVWYRAWPALLFGSMAGAVLGFVLAAFRFAGRDPDGAGAWVAAGIVNVLTLFVVFQNFPSA